MRAVESAADVRRARTGRSRAIPHRDAVRLGDSRGPSGRGDGAAHVGIRLTSRHQLVIRRGDTDVAIGPEHGGTQARAHSTIEDMRVPIDTRCLGVLTVVPMVVRLMRGLGLGPRESVVCLVHDARTDPKEEDGHQNEPPQGRVDQEGSETHGILNVPHGLSVPAVGWKPVATSRPSAGGVR